MKKLKNFKQIKLRKIDFNKINKKLIIILIILVLLGASQWWAVRMVYAKKLSPAITFWYAKTLHLQAGKIIGPEKSFIIPLSDYLENIDFAKKYLNSQLAKSQTEQMGDFQMPSEDSIRQAAWDKLAKDAWLTDIAQKNDLVVSEQDIKDAIEMAGSLEEYKASIEKDYGLSFDAYKRLIIRPSVLEAKVYKYLLDNYNDRAGMEKAQAAYDALSKDQRDFVDVAKEYSADLNFAEKSIFVSEDELGEFAEPIKKLTPDQYSQILVMPGSPGSYVILKLIASTQDPNTGKEVKELRGIAIQAKSIEEFFADYSKTTKTQKWY